MDIHLQNLKQLLTKKSGRELFGEQGKYHPNYHKFAKVCHPDINKDPLAKEIFLLLEKKVLEVANEVTITSNRTSYKINGTPFKEGDISDIYLTTDRQYLLKVSKAEKFNSLINESGRIIKQIQPDRDKQPILYQLFPNIRDSFLIEPKRSCQVFDYDDALFTLEDIHSKYSQLDPRSFAWIFKRLLLSLGWAHVSGFIHGAVLPQHFLAQRDTHGGHLVGWIHSVEGGKHIEYICSKCQDFYPKEVVDKQAASNETDIYMAGKCAIYLLGGDVKTNVLPRTVPDRIRTFLSALLLPKAKYRPNDAKELHDQFGDILRIEYGQPKFVRLEI